MTDSPHKEVSTSDDDGARDAAPKKPVVIDVTESDQHASDEGADASEIPDGRGSPGGWGAGTD